jgi:alpha-tubulin suppressor-like RCC1 family protein
VWAWGNNELGQLGDGTIVSRGYHGQVAGLENIVSVSSAGWGTGMALRSDGTVWTWGSNYDGALGNGSSEEGSLSPVQVLTELEFSR